MPKTKNWTDCIPAKATDENNHSVRKIYSIIFQGTLHLERPLYLNHNLRYGVRRFECQKQSQKSEKFCATG